MGQAVAVRADKGPQLIPRKLDLREAGELKKNPEVYEAHRRQVDKINSVIEAMGPGEELKQGSFALGAGLGTTAAVSGITGTFKRGGFTLTISGAGLAAATATITINFPDGTFAGTPFAIVQRNGGTGALSHTWTESKDRLVITLGGLPTAGNTYIFRFAIRD